ncbi:hypothetical protein [Parabacteroides sp. FAFU027]|uniref:hypothetical protein n=1 Tax=Parabacteroides sp. FAFU027 TaxID=2922715 RepID=UPI001FAF0CDE|nr:hypothetical protein [Parabacteroides sp. FAFU027]
MNAINDTVNIKLSELICQATEKYKQKEEPGTLTDLFVQLNTANSDVAVYDDSEQLLAEMEISELEEINNTDEKNIFKIIENILRDVLSKPDVLAKFEELDPLRPFSVLLVDESFEHQAEIYLLEDGNLIIEDSLFKDIDKELDSFLDKLMEE